MTCPGTSRSRDRQVRAHREGVGVEAHTGSRRPGVPRVASSRTCRSRRCESGCTASGRRRPPSRRRWRACRTARADPQLPAPGPGDEARRISAGCTRFVPDRFAGGILGAFLAAIAGSVIFGLLVSGLSVPARDDVDVVTALIGIPGSLIGMGIDYRWGRCASRGSLSRPERGFAPRPGGAGLRRRLFLPDSPYAWTRQKHSVVAEFASNSEVDSASTADDRRGRRRHSLPPP
jgi:hypothetical protein